MGYCFVGALGGVEKLACYFDALFLMYVVEKLVFDEMW